MESRKSWLWKEGWHLQRVIYTVLNVWWSAGFKVRIWQILCQIMSVPTVNYDPGQQCFWNSDSLVEELKEMRNWQRRCGLILVIEVVIVSDSQFHFLIDIIWIWHLDIYLILSPLCKKNIGQRKTIVKVENFCLTWDPTAIWSLNGQKIIMVIFSMVMLICAIIIINKSLSS